MKANLKVLIRHLSWPAVCRNDEIENSVQNIRTVLGGEEGDDHERERDCRSGQNFPTADLYFPLTTNMTLCQTFSKTLSILV